MSNLAGVGQLANLTKLNIAGTNITDKGLYSTAIIAAVAVPEYC